MSVTEERCECCDLVLTSCGKAVEALARRQAMLDRQAFARRGAFPSAYAGACSGCGEHFVERALILRAPDGSGWLAECCA